MHEATTDDFDMFAMFDELIVSSDLQQTVDDMQAAGMSNQSILRQIVSGRWTCGRQVPGSAARNRGFGTLPPSADSLSRQRRGSSGTLLRANLHGADEHQYGTAADGGRHLVHSEQINWLRSSLKKAYRIDATPCFTDLLHAIDHAETLARAGSSGRDCRA